MWRLVDIGIVIVLIIFGFILQRSDDVKIKRVNIAGLIKSRKFLYCLLALIIIVVASLVIIYQMDKREIALRQCRFSLTDTKENRYQEDKDEEPEKRSGFTAPSGTYIPLFFGRQFAVHKTYWEIEGLLRNTSARRQYLMSMITKIYTKDSKNILLSTGYKEVNNWLEPGQSYPFQVRAQVDRSDSVLSKYFNKDDEVRIDVYPWFSTCD